MSSNANPNRVRTVAFRLTAWYLVLFTLAALALMFIAHARLRATLRQRTDADLVEDLAELEALYVTRGITTLQANFEREAASSGIENLFLLLVQPQGKILASSDLKPWKDVVLPPKSVGPLLPGHIAHQILTGPGREVAVRMACKGMADGNNLFIGLSLAEEDEWMKIFRQILASAMLAMIVSGGFMGWRLAHRAMDGVKRVTQTALQIGQDRLGKRVNIGREGQEIERLAQAFNGMLERIDSLVKNLREVTDNLAHDLRSPLTRLRGLAETTITSDSRPVDCSELAATVVEETDALIALLNTMLEIARTDSGMHQLMNAPIDVGALVATTIELFRPAAEDCGISLKYAAAAEDLTICGDLARLQRVMANLMDNAMKHTPCGGTISLSVTRDQGHVTIVVADTGDGIAAKDLPRIFDRFYRGDASRSQPGSGLGLSLSLAIVRAHKGDIRVESAPGKGSVFTIWLPKPNAAPQTPPHITNS